ncbi:acyl carrier protein [Streptomyces sp. NPDC005962]|uniref:acyl carrier protein n=1 Tax=Streptomyces sp. NPDC005962 TaxID=3154466 RepID=UPI0033FEE69D
MGRTETIRQFIEEQFLVEFGGELTDETDLFKAGVIDSFGYIQMLAFLREEFSLQISDEDVLLDVFVSLAAIDSFVEKKSGRSDALRGGSACAE